MKKQIIISLAFLTLLGSGCIWASRLLGVVRILSLLKSMKIKPVTFASKRPNADEVKLTGDWMPVEGWVPGSVAHGQR